jgi:hypothetical protein
MAMNFLLPAAEAAAPVCANEAISGAANVSVGESAAATELMPAAFRKPLREVSLPPIGSFIVCLVSCLAREHALLSNVRPMAAL